MKVAIRTDASTAIGLGHVKRCLSLAQALRERGATVAFFSRTTDVDIRALLQTEGFVATPLGTERVADASLDAADFVRSSRVFAPELVVVDHYALSAEWHRAVRAATPVRLAAIDDLGDRGLDVELLIDPNLSPDHALKFAGLLPARTPLLGGPHYALLGPRYANARRHVPQPVVHSIGIFMGGTDAPNFSALALDACRRLVGFAGAIEIATTESNPNLGPLRSALKNQTNTRLTLNQPDLADFFARHGLHIGAGGGATWERCCIGAPTLALLAAPNQYHVLMPLRHLGVLEVIAADPPEASHIAAALNPLLADAPRRAALSATARALVDGRGAARVADHLMSMPR